MQRKRNIFKEMFDVYVKEVKKRRKKRKKIKHDILCARNTSHFGTIVSTRRINDRMLVKKNFFLNFRGCAKCKVSKITCKENVSVDRGANIINRLKLNRRRVTLISPGKRQKKKTNCKRDVISGKFS